MAVGEGFQPCAVESGANALLPRWEKHWVLAALTVHVIDVSCDIIVTLLFLFTAEWGYFFGCAGVLVWAWVVSSLYVSFGASASTGDIDDRPPNRWGLPQCVLSFAQVQIFVEAHNCLRLGRDTDYFHTLRLMEAILESAPSALIQLYALLMWADQDSAPAAAGFLLHVSVFMSFLSVGLGLAMWEQKVQFRVSPMYVASVAMMRGLEIASRSVTLAVFAAVTHPHGFLIALVFDYCAMLFLVARHQSVQFSYGIFVALPLVLISLEPLVWRREDHAVPKDAYYMVRVVESIVMWFVIMLREDFIPDLGLPADFTSYQAMAVISTVGLYVTLPFVWQAARQVELSRDVTAWGEEGVADSLHGDPLYSDSEPDYDSEEEEENNERSPLNAPEPLPVVEGSARSAREDEPAE